MKYVVCMGEVYKLSRRNYRKYLEAVAAGDINADLRDFGGKYICDPTNVTDITSDWAEVLLAMAKEEAAK